MPRATVTSKGQITIPRSIRQALKVGSGDRLDFVLEAEGRESWFGRPCATWGSSRASFANLAEGP
jgi:AbrB family looped-hinge helix DNA binding protein